MLIPFWEVSINKLHHWGLTILRLRITQFHVILRVTYLWKSIHRLDFAQGVLDYSYSISRFETNAELVGITGLVVRVQYFLPRGSLFFVILFTALLDYYPFALVFVPTGFLEISLFFFFFYKNSFLTFSMFLVSFFYFEFGGGVKGL